MRKGVRLRVPSANTAVDVLLSLEKFPVCGFVYFILIHASNNASVNFERAIFRQNFDFINKCELL